MTSGAFAGPRNALDFDGVNDFVELGNPSELQITGNLTIEAWFSTTLTVANYKQLVAKYIIASGIYPPLYVSERPAEKRMQLVDAEYFSDPDQNIHYLEEGDLQEQYFEVLKLVQRRLRERDGVSKPSRTVSNII